MATAGLPQCRAMTVTGEREADLATRRAQVAEEAAAALGLWFDDGSCARLRP